MDAGPFGAKSAAGFGRGAPVASSRGASTPAPLRCRLSFLLLIALLLAGLLSPVSAQQTPTPAAAGLRGAELADRYTGQFPDIQASIDTFWATTFRAASRAYRSPQVIFVDHVTATRCTDVADPDGGPFYCPADETIYLQPRLLSSVWATIGDYAPIMILAHEWGHHVQQLADPDMPRGKASELQADCLSGVYTQEAQRQDLLDPGDVTEAVLMSEEAGDEPWWPQDTPDAHGINDERISAFISGYTDGLSDCNLRGFGSDNVPSPPRVPQAPVDIPSSSLAAYLPATMPLVHSACFRVENDHTLTFEDLIGRLGGTEEVRNRLQGWGWQASANRAFACDTPPEGEAGWVDISLHLFGDAASAQQALDYFAAVRQQGTRLMAADPPAIGDHAAVLTGPVSNGKEFTLYVTDGPLLVRITGVSPSGIPFINVLTVTRAILAVQQGALPSVVVRQESAPVLAASAYLPTSPAVRHAVCFAIQARGNYAYDDVVNALSPLGLNRSEIDGLGWQDGAYIVFTCADPPPGRASQIDVGIHRFQDGPSAQRALPFYDDMYHLGENAARDCDAVGAVVVCVSGRSLSGSPLSDVQFVLQQVLAAIP